MPSGSIYTFIGTSTSSNNIGAIETSQGTVARGQYGYFLLSEYLSAVADGCILQAGIVGPAVPAVVGYGPAILGNDGTVGGVGGSPLAGALVNYVKATMFNPKSPVYGATGDGVTVDTIAMNNCIADLLAAGGGILALPPGIYVGAMHAYGSNVVVRGAGIGVSTLLMDPAVYTNSGLYNNPTTALVGRVAPSSGVTLTSNFVMENLTIDGNQSVWGSNSNNRMMGFYLGQGTQGLISHCKMRNVEIRNCKSYAFDIENATDIDLESCWAHDNGFVGGSGTNNQNDGFTLLGSDITVVTSRSYNNSGSGFLAGQNGVTWNRVKLIGCNASGNNNHGASLGSNVSGALYDSQVIGGSFLNGATGAGVQLTTNAINCAVTGATVVGNSQNGIRLSGATYCTVSGNTVRNNAIGGNTNPEIYLTGSSIHNTVAGNTVNSTTATNAVKEQNSSSDFNAITGNTLTSTGTTISLAGVNSLTSNNVGFDGQSAQIGSTVPLGDTTTAVAGVATVASRQDHTHPRKYWVPGDHGLITWSFDPPTVSGSTVLPTAGLLTVIKMHVPLAASVTNILVGLNTAGGTLTTGQCFAALWQSGTLLGTTADQAANWGGSTGLKTMAISGGPVAAAAGDVVVGFWFNGTTGPAFSRGANVSLINAGLSNANSRFGTADSGLTTTAPSTLGAVTAVSNAIWVGLS